MFRRRSLAVGIVGVTGALSLLAGSATAQAGLGWSPVPEPNPKQPGLTTPNTLSPQLTDVVRAQGSMELENPTDGVGYYGYDSVDDNPPLMPVLPDTTEAHKTEPDKNTYLDFKKSQPGPDADYDYGTHFLFQGHESGTPGYVSRVNLDADQAHRVTIMSTKDADGSALPDFDGSTWDPFAKKLLFTAEAGCSGGVWQGSARWSPDLALTDISGSLGRAGYEGIETASDGSVWLVEDTGGSTDSDKAKNANSYVYRFVPADPRDLTSGKLEVLQVLRGDGTPMDTKADTYGQDLEDLHSYGTSFRTRWVTIHDTATDGTEPFCATTLADAQGGTEFKRPENGVFRPGTGFREFYFTETGDTNKDSKANDQYGGWGGVFRLTQKSPSADTGKLSLAFRGDEGHTGLDNLTFASRDDLLVVEDAGDTLHTQRNALDSGFVIDVSQDRPSAPRFLAEGRDPSATIDSALGDAHTSGFDNDGDNEITGIHVSDGDPTVKGLLGTKVPHLFQDGWRMFWTQQHGDNVTYEVVPSH